MKKNMNAAERLGMVHTATNILQLLYLKLGEK